MKKGFTIIELLSVLVILVVIGLLIIPSISKDITKSKEKAYQADIATIKYACREWITENPSELTNVTFFKMIKIKRLQEDGFLGYDMKNPKTRNAFVDEEVKIVKKAVGFECEVEF
jgi:prepilin-type N-terminal cleavage/methylation domain-containing protein